MPRGAPAANMPPVPSPSLRTVAELFLHRVESTPDAPAYLAPEGKGWRTFTWRELGERVRAIACGLRALGLEGEQRCAILSSTRLEWIAADFGILCAGGAVTTIYPSTTADDCAYILEDSEAAFVFAEGSEQLAKLASKRAELGVKKVITLDGEPDGDWVISLAELERLGRAQDERAPAQYEELARAVRPDALATLIYTSGTTGRPKGVELLHSCWVYEAEAIDRLGLLTPEDVQYLWLPLAHSFGKVLEVAQLRLGFVTAVDGRVERLVENLATIRPTFVAAVPRIFEKVHNKVVAGAVQGGAVKRALFEWAMGVGRKASARRQQGQPLGGLLALEHGLADRLVFSKLKERFGGRLRFFVSGSAPLARELAEFFHAAGVLILEGYGLTESSAATCVNLPHRNRFGTVGPVLPGTKLEIASDGEVLIRGPGVMRGYHKLPEATAEALDSEGWLHTGDIGELVDGFLRITDRKKDLIKTSGGKYVAPQSLEGRLKVLCPYVGQVVVHGDGRPYVTALLTLDEEAIRSWAKENGLGDLSPRELAGHERVRALLQTYVDRLNSALASYETVKRFAVLPKDLSLEEGELTPSLKVKRKVVEHKYRSLLDGLYGPKP